MKAKIRVALLIVFIGAPLVLWFNPLRKTADSEPPVPARPHEVLFGIEDPYQAEREDARAAETRWLEMDRRLAGRLAQAGPCRAGDLIAPVAAARAEADRKKALYYQRQHEALTARRAQYEKLPAERGRLSETARSNVLAQLRRLLAAESMLYQAYYAALKARNDFECGVPDRILVAKFAFPNIRKSGDRGC
jgi:hypothetical protein